jgi:hypothetical protein
MQQEDRRNRIPFRLGAGELCEGDVIFALLVHDGTAMPTGLTQLGTYTAEDDAAAARRAVTHTARLTVTITVSLARDTDHPSPLLLLLWPLPSAAVRDASSLGPLA